MMQTLYQAILKAQRDARLLGVPVCIHYKRLWIAVWPDGTALGWVK